jgi:methyltransferase (TIGR00027 family)
MSTSSPSGSARYVALAVAFVGGDERHGSLVPPEAAKLSLACIKASPGPLRWAVWFWDKAWMKNRIRRGEKNALPGAFLHVAARKRAVEEHARKAIAEGFTQVVVVGAGYDTLAARLYKSFPKVRFIELDRVPTQRVKMRAVLGKLLPAPNLASATLNLTRETLQDALARCPLYKSNADTLFICEGLLMYLPREAVNELFAAMRGQGSARSRALFTFLEAQADGAIDFARTKSAGVGLRDLPTWKREPFLFGLAREHLDKWLGERGFAKKELLGSQTFRHHYLGSAVEEGEPVAAGEYLCVADRVKG